MADRLATLIATRATAWDKMNELRAAIGETVATAEQRTEWDRIEADLNTFGADIDAEKRIAGMESGFAKIDERIAAKDPTVDAPPSSELEEKRVAAAYGQFLRGGMSSLKAEQRAIMATRAQADATGGAGGYLVPQGYWLKITETLKAFGGLMGVSNIIRTTSGQTLPWPSNNDTGNSGHLLTENTQITETDLTIGQKQLNAWTYTSDLVLVSLQLLNDSAFDLDTWLPKKLGQRLGRGMAADFVNGSGTARPIGLALNPTVAVTGAAGEVAGISYDDTVDMVHSIDPAYRQLGNCRWVMNDLSVGVLRKLVDTQGRPLWSPSMVQGIAGPEPDTYLGYPITVDNAMPVMAANAKSVLFGDFEAGYVVRQVLDPTIMRLTERYADYLQVGFFGFLRVDGAPDDAAAVHAFANPAA